MKIKRKMIARKLFTTTAESYSSGMIIHAII